MADSAEMVKTLSAKKQRRSLGETGKKEKAKAFKKPARTTVINPTEIEWPDLDDETQTEFLNILEKRISVLKFPFRTAVWSKIKDVPANERAEFRKKWISEQAVNVGFDVSRYTYLRSTVCIGVNCVSQALEAGMLAGVVIEKEVDPPIITKLLIPIALAKGVPIIAVSGLNTIMSSTTGIRCIALGFKKACEDIAQQFYPLLEIVKENDNLKNSAEEEVSEPKRIKLDESSTSLTSSQEDDDKTKKDEPEPQQPQPEDPAFGLPAALNLLASSSQTSTLSYADQMGEIAKAVDALRKGLTAGDFNPPKIRRVTPKK